jgi:hypothetical protein
MRFAGINAFLWFPNWFGKNVWYVILHEKKTAYKNLFVFCKPANLDRTREECHDIKFHFDSSYNTLKLYDFIVYGGKKNSCR